MLQVFCTHNAFTTLIFGNLESRLESFDKKIYNVTFVKLKFVFE